jgi:hypothetical protein
MKQREGRSAQGGPRNAPRGKGRPEWLTVPHPEPLLPGSRRLRPRLLDPQLIATVHTYRDAVRLCWTVRSRPGMTQRQIAEETGAYASHINDYISADESKRELPAKRINAFELSCGNRAISQWVAHRAGLQVSYAPAARRTGKSL